MDGPFFNNAKQFDPKRKYKIYIGLRQLTSWYFIDIFPFQECMFVYTVWI
jgi:hypothetical protein